VKVEKWAKNGQKGQNSQPLSPGNGRDLNFDGTVDPTGLAVKGAVDDFAIKIRRQVVLVYDERPSQFWTWMMGK